MRKFTGKHWQWRTFLLKKVSIPSLLVNLVTFFGCFFIQRFPLNVRNHGQILCVISINSKDAILLVVIRKNLMWVQYCFWLKLMVSVTYRRSHQWCSIKIFVKLTRKHLCQTLLFSKVGGLKPASLLKKMFWHRCFSVNFTKFLKTPLQKTPPSDYF